MKLRLAALVVLAYAIAVPSAQAAVTATTTFSYTGSEQVFVVPVGVGTLTVHAVGGAGGCDFTQQGHGGDVTATISVIPGQLLYVEVGGNGAAAGPAAGGFNGGGAGDYDESGLSGGGGGGGASDVRTAPRSAGNTLASRQVIAGGGGGGGGNNSICGGDAGSSRGGSASADPGGAGTGSAGGSGGASTGCAYGGDGSLGQGGYTGTGPCAEPGGGGGGGLYGGGGGGGGDVGAGGGGGSSAAPGDPNAVIGVAAGTTSEIDLTYAVPTADAAPANVTFPGTQPLTTTSAPQTVTVTNNGSAPLVISGYAFSGAQAGDYFVGSSTCGGPVAPGSSCALDVRFAPQATGASAASLDITSNVPSGNNPTSTQSIPLSGTGGALPAGPPGPQGPPGKVRLVTCKQVVKIVHGKKKTVQVCKTKVLSGTVTIRTGTAVRLLHAGRLVARGRVTRGTIEFQVLPGRKLRTGRYTLIAGPMRQTLLLQR